MGGTELSGDRAQEIGARIVQARKELGGMRQEELAELIGVSVRSMQAYESGEVVPYKKLRDLERVLGRPMSWILHGDASVSQLDQIRDLNDERNQLLREIVQGQQQILEALTRGSYVPSANVDGASGE